MAHHPDGSPRGSPRQGLAYPQPAATMAGMPPPVPPVYGGGNSAEAAGGLIPAAVAYPFVPSASPYAYAPAGAGSSSGAGYTPEAAMHRPYDMPSFKPSMQEQPWAGGGPVGSGVVPVDVEAQVLQAFAERTVRNGFIRKVLGIVAVQLAITVGFAMACFFITPIKSYVRSTPWPFYLSWGLSFGLMLVIACNERIRRRYPINMILLGAFTLCEAFLVGMITSFFDIEAVVIAFLTTCVAVAVLALIACQTKVDVTSWASFLLVPAAIILVLVLVGVFWVSRVSFLIAGFAAVLASVYIVYDLQLIMGGKQYAISPDEYVFAALSLYLDIVQLFIWILYLVGLSRD